MFKRSSPTAALKNTFSDQLFQLSELFHPNVHFGLACPLITKSSEVGDVVRLPSAFRYKFAPFSSNPCHSYT